MGRPRKPLALLELSGSLEHNKKRHQDRLNEPESNGPIGPPPDYFDAFHLAVWDELVDEAPDLRLSDSMHVELTVRLLCKLRAYQFHSAKMLDFFESALAKRGMGTEGMAELRSAFNCLIGCSSQEMRLLAGCLGKLGMAPADRTKVFGL